MASHSEFARFEDRVDETIEKQIGRVEAKLDDLGRAVRSLAVVEDRQNTHAQLVKDLRSSFEQQLTDMRASSSAMGERFERRAVGMGERFDTKVSDLGKAQAALDAKVSAYVQRYVGGSIVLAAGWAVVSHFLHL